MSKEYGNTRYESSLFPRQSNGDVGLLEPFEYIAEWLLFQDARDLGVFEVDDPRDIDAHEEWDAYFDWHHRDDVIRSESRAHRCRVDRDQSTPRSSPWCGPADLAAPLR